MLACFTASAFPKAARNAHVDFCASTLSPKSWQEAGVQARARDNSNFEMHLNRVGGPRVKYHLLIPVQIVPVTYSSLKQSDAGRVLKNLRNTHADPAVRKQAKAVIAQWKKAVVVRTNPAHFG